MKICPEALLIKIGVLLTFPNALTGEFTPPGITDFALLKRDLDLFVLLKIKVVYKKAC